ncbi:MULTISPECIES: aminodeoxychorismate lyase [unclassified Arthrobacter]|uniref:aminodeoxychorismate lyase n=1 Tax=unclassified Arthrobacter TaxID=235627 RepID=UPI0002F6857F|nr:MULTISPECIES: aminodeoxychorismate lyase [unclassified Arthrobacter]PVE18670.1 aminodeoxychorismate lyase [Arthrobacter sp. Bz4]
MTVLVFLDPAHDDGRVVDASLPQLMATDLGATRGDGIFESLLALNGEARKVQAHLDRLASSARALDLDLPSEDAWRRAITTALDEYAAGAHVQADTELAVKLMVTRGVEGADAPTAWVQVAPVPAKTQQQRRDGLAVLFLERGYDSTVAQRAPWLLMGAKTLSYAVNMAAVRYARAHDADDVIFTSSDGKVLEGPTSTVLLARVRDGVKTLLTPQLESGILPGTSQSALFTVAKAAGWELGYGPLVPADLYDADGVWLISSIRLLAPVNSLDGQPITTTPELTRELSELVAKIS